MKQCDNLIIVIHIFFTSTACGGLHREHQGTITSPFRYTETDWTRTCIHTIQPEQFNKIYIKMKATRASTGTCTDSIRVSMVIQRLHNGVKRNATASQIINTKLNDMNMRKHFHVSF